LQLLSSFPFPDFLVILHIDESEVARSNDNLRAKWTVLPPYKSVAAIPEDAIARPILLSFLISAKSRLII